MLNSTSADSDLTTILTFPEMESYTGESGITSYAPDR